MRCQTERPAREQHQQEATDVMANTHVRVKIARPGTPRKVNKKLATRQPS